MLSVANIGTLLGGTGACALDCVRALPEFDHTVVFVCPGGTPQQILIEAFGCPVLFGSGAVEAVIRTHPDITLWHNTRAHCMPRVRSNGMVWVFYQHSGARALRRSRSRCAHSICVSHHLAAVTGLPDEAVLHQPVSAPSKVERGRSDDMFTVGRLCTRRSGKWPESILPVYASMSETASRIHFEFVGCPPTLRARLSESCDGRVTWHSASREAQSLFWRWHAMSYSGPSETYGRTVCEAQQAGCVPIVDHRGGFIEQIQNGETGFLCQDAEEFSAAVRRLQDPTQWQEMSARAQSAGRRRGSLERWATEFRKIVGLSNPVRSPAVNGESDE